MNMKFAWGQQSDHGYIIVNVETKCSILATAVETLWGRSHCALQARHSVCLSFVQKQANMLLVIRQWH